MVREYILHDRGNSIYLGDSFGNLPSPVNEGATIKKLFKFNEDDPMDKKRKNESKNQAIRIEGKKDKATDRKEKSPEKVPKTDIKMRITEIDKIVFQATNKNTGKVAVMNQSKKSIAAKKSVNDTRGSIKPNDTRQSIKPYEEEESYENPVNLSKTPGIADEYFDIKSDYVPPGRVNNSIGVSKGFVNIDCLELDDSIQNDY